MTQPGGSSSSSGVASAALTPVNTPPAQGCALAYLLLFAQYLKKKGWGPAKANQHAVSFVLGSSTPGGGEDLFGKYMVPVSLNFYKTVALTREEHGQKFNQLIEFYRNKQKEGAGNSQKDEALVMRRAVRDLASHKALEWLRAHGYLTKDQEAPGQEALNDSFEMPFELPHEWARERRAKRQSTRNGVKNTFIDVKPVSDAPLDAPLRRCRSADALRLEDREEDLSLEPLVERDDDEVSVFSIGEDSFLAGDAMDSLLAGDAMGFAPEWQSLEEEGGDQEMGTARDPAQDVRGVRGQQQDSESNEKADDAPGRGVPLAENDSTGGPAALNRGSVAALVEGEDDSEGGRSNDAPGNVSVSVLPPAENHSTGGPPALTRTMADLLRFYAIEEITNMLFASPSGTTAVSILQVVNRLMETASVPEMLAERLMGHEALFRMIRNSPEFFEVNEELRAVTLRGLSLAPEGGSGISPPVLGLDFQPSSYPPQGTVSALTGSFLQITFDARPLSLCVVSFEHREGLVVGTVREGARVTLMRFPEEGVLLLVDEEEEEDHDGDGDEDEDEDEEGWEDEDGLGEGGEWEFHMDGWDSDWDSDSEGEEEEGEGVEPEEEPEPQQEEDGRQEGGRGGERHERGGERIITIIRDPPSALWLAAEGADLNAVRALVAGGAGVNEADASGDTPLDIAEYWAEVYWNDPPRARVYQRIATFLEENGGMREE